MHVCTLTSVVVSVVSPVDALCDVRKPLVVLTYRCLCDLQRAQAHLRCVVTIAVVRARHQHRIDSVSFHFRKVSRVHLLDKTHGVV